MRSARLLILGVCLGMAAVADAERLPIQTFRRSDGLGADRVKCLLLDSRGLLWVGTGLGVDWFDGLRFTGHTLNEWLAFSTNAILEAPDHTYWIATNGRGVVHFDPAGEHPATWPPGARVSLAPRIRPYAVGQTSASNRVNTLFRDRTGTLWAGTDDGVFRLDTSMQFRDADLPDADPRHLQVWSFAETSDGSLWIGASGTIYRRPPGGRFERQPLPSVTHAAWSLLAMPDGSLLIAHDGGVSRAAIDPHRPGGVADEGLVDGLSIGAARVLYRGPDGAIWIGYARPLLERFDGRHVEQYTGAQGIPADGVGALTHDADGNLWLSDGVVGGVVRILRNGVRTYGDDDGVWGGVVPQLIETRRRGICALGGSDVEPKFDCFDGHRFRAVHPALPRPAEGWQQRRRTIQAHDGSWWFATDRGLYRFPPTDRPQDLARARPDAVYTNVAGAPPLERARGLFEDGRGDLWIWFDTAAGYPLSRRLHDTGKFVPVEGVPPTKQVYEVGEDAEGDVWLGFRDGGLARWRDGTVRLFGPSDGITAPWVAAIYRDRRARLWIGTGGDTGLVMVEHPSSERPRFVAFGTPSAFPGPRSAGAFVEDRWGNLYVTSGIGVYRMEASAPLSDGFEPADSLTDLEPTAVIADDAGSLWFGTWQGIARFVPEGVAPPKRPDIRIQALHIGGVPYPLSFLGEADVASVSIPIGYSPIDIDYASAAGNVSYEYQLEGSHSGWHPVADRSITLANLAAGSYRFSVRAIRRGSSVAGTPATVAFTIVPPIWQRGWFLTLIGLGVTVLGYRLHRYRLARVLELERIRTRIATDLHDDIGASLTRIAVLSAVASRRLSAASPELREPLESIGATAGELVDAMGDIVWAINPRRQAVRDLSGRMRRFASDLLGGHDIAFRFDAPDQDREVFLSPEVRRAVYLVFKEGARNIVRHARCTEVESALRLQGGWLDLTLRDNGVGFDPARRSDGHGLESFRARASALRGTVDIDSAPGRGTTIRLRLPLAGTFSYLHR